MLSGNYYTGAVSSTVVDKCIGDGQYNEKTCRAPRDLTEEPVAGCSNATLRYWSNGFTVRLWSSPRNGPGYLQMVNDLTRTLEGTPHLLPPMNGLNLPPSAIASSDMRRQHGYHEALSTGMGGTGASALQSGGPGAILFGIGYHDQCNTTLTVRALHSLKNATRRIVASRLGRRKPRLVYMPVHALGRGVNPQYASDYANNEHIRRVNHQTSAAAREIGYEVFDAFSLTHSERLDGAAAASFPESYDGVHYAMGVNVLKAQLLLNMLNTAEDDSSVRLRKAWTQYPYNE